MFDAMNSLDSAIPYDQRHPKTVHRVMPIEALLVEATDHEGRTSTRVVLRAGDQVVYVDQNVVATNGRPWLVKGIKQALGEK